MTRLHCEPSHYFDEATNKKILEVLILGGGGVHIASSQATPSFNTEQLGVGDKAIVEITIRYM